jgi:hypothetical protein
VWGDSGKITILRIMLSWVPSHVFFHSCLVDSEPHFSLCAEFQEREPTNDKERQGVVHVDVC